MMIGIQRGAAVVLGGVLLVAGGCASEGGSMSLRPLVESSAAELPSAQPTGAASLDFFDTLESRRLVCHDDVLHAALLVGNGHSEPTPAARMALARRLGYVPQEFSRPAREAATAGELARLAVHLSDGDDVSGLTQDAALSRLTARGAIPVSVKAYQGVTGAQLLSVMSVVRLANQDRPMARVMLGDGAAGSSVAAAAPVPVAPSPRSSAVASAADAGAGEVGGAGVAGGGGPAEPLPDSARDPALEQPTAAPANDPTWVPGRPLKRPENKPG